MKRKLIISLLVGCLLSVLGFYFAFRNVPFDELVASMVSINYLWLLPAAAIGLFSFILRTVRWQLILSTTLKLSFFSAFHPMMIGFMINTVLPGRVGELARPAIIKKQDDVPFSLGMTTIAAERMFDAIALILLFAWVLATVHIDPDLQIQFRSYELSKETLENIASGMIRICIALVVGVVAISIPAVQQFLKSLIMKAPNLLIFAGRPSKEKFREKCCQPLAKIIDHIASGLSMVKYPLRLALCMLYSFVIWLLQAAALYIVALGFPELGLDFTEMTTVFIIICFFIALPSVPGFWGLWEAGGVFGMALFGVAANAAAGFSLVSHAMLMFPVLIVGIISAIVTGVNIVNVSYEGAEEADQTDPDYEAPPH